MATTGATTFTSTTLTSTVEAVDAVTTRSPSGWFCDPSGRHEARWYSVGMPTKLVRDGAVDSYDPTPVYDISPPRPLRAGSGGGRSTARRGVIASIVGTLTAVRRR